MKQPKAPTRDQKERIAKAGLNWRDWQVEYQTGELIMLVSKKTGERKPIGGETDGRAKNQSKGGF
jgi:hypothetical protein